MISERSAGGKDPQRRAAVEASKDDAVPDFSTKSARNTPELSTLLRKRARRAPPILRHDLKPNTKVKPMTALSPVKASPGGVAAILKGAGRWCRVRLAELVQALMERDARHRASRQLARLEDHLLRDIGLTRDDVRGRRP